MSTLGNLMAAGRSVDGSRRADYRVVNGPAVPAINQGRPKGYGNGLVERVREEMNRRMQARNRNPFSVSASAASASAPGGASALPVATATPGDEFEVEPVGAERKVDAAPSGVGDGAKGGMEGERTVFLAASKAPARDVASAGAGGRGFGVMARMWAWLRRGGKGKGGDDSRMYQEELRLDSVKPLRSRLQEPELDREAEGGRGNDAVVDSGIIPARRGGGRKLDILGRKSNPFIDGAEPGLTGSGGKEMGTRGMPGVGE